MLLMGGCVSKDQFDTVNNDYLIAQKSQGELQRALEESKKEIDQCRAENSQLNRQIAIQMSVIRLFDDGDQTLQTSIQEQISSQNLQTTE